MRLYNHKGALKNRNEIYEKNAEPIKQLMGIIFLMI